MTTSALGSTRPRRPASVVTHPRHATPRQAAASAELAADTCVYYYRVVDPIRSVDDNRNTGSVTSAINDHFRLYPVSGFVFCRRFFSPAGARRNLV